MDNSTTLQDQPPLFDNVDINTPEEENDIFESAVQVLLKTGYILSCDILIRNKCYT